MLPSHITMLTYEEALAHVLAALPPAKPEKVPVAEAAGRFLTEAVSSPLDLPPFDNSAMDGYAVRAADIATASAEKPVVLRRVGQIGAGEVFAGNVGMQTCVRLFTGTPLPAGADAVVMQEDTRTDEARPDEVQILDRARPWENVRLRGEDVKAGTVVATPGTRLSAGHLNLLAAVGTASVRVAKRPCVALLATGNELRAPGKPLAPGQIYESNRAMLAALLAECGAEARVFPLVPDSLNRTCNALKRAFAECDAVVTTGGASVGQLDFVKAAFVELGGSQEFWKVAIKPGKPFVFGTLAGKFLFGLPGNPVSAYVTFLLLVRPALLRWQGAAETGLPAHPGTLAEPLVNRGDRRHFVRVRVDAAGNVHSAGTQASHMLHSLAAANGLVDVPPETTLAAGTNVRVLRP
ncbi:MAG: molybdopterin molybdenumtransferase MoeA [Proteobacteria bacterium]|nr:molybdopterin molybdenumtransferase MoeA [Verrucomicrobiota bacterium]NBU08741.1 molybdopterin molybdenumtransferase MoeA [Pseudomonadota bacterium]